MNVIGGGRDDGSGDTLRRFLESGGREAWIVCVGTSTMAREWSATSVVSCVVSFGAGAACSEQLWQAKQSELQAFFFRVLLGSAQALMLSFLFSV